MKGEKMFILDAKKIKTTLKKGDTIIFLPREKTISLHRKNITFFFSGCNDKIPFPWSRPAFKALVKLLAETHGFYASLTEKSSPSRIIYKFE